ncbi:monogalactosyldiacylglycerol synthase [Cupriavidus basilensis OR16]|uniref:Monogalactosyldiacylglycerol synthase n=1 Tax=Cupriavidus basilensis OR16 TaxID=1127483 RepID=H1SGX5_9BURK|nr:glycosyltransferase [Cupriavidus basilensis]EHP38220.1 monogalactosyldiacylglycerol synthase [Cupriavidus basilensis OR16]
MSQQKILFLSVSAGAGHMRAAEALRLTAEAEFPGVQTLHLDVMEYVPATFRKLYTDFYIKLVNSYPALWGMLYQHTSEADPAAPMQKLRRAAERLSTRALRRAIDEFAPDAIVCTHFLPAEILMHEVRRQRLAVPVWVQVTDFDLHGMWVIPHMTGYFAASEEIAFRMRASRIEAGRIHATGIPVVPAFSRPQDRQACARHFGLDPARRTIMLMGGGAGLGGLDEVAGALMRLEHDFQLIVLAGRNETALARLKTLSAAHPGRLFPFGFTNEVERLMACSDLVITKPGGLTTSECLAMGVPMVVNAPIPGQEERNADYLLEQGAALKAVDLVSLEYRVRLLLAEPARLDQMRARASALGQPAAARRVLETVLGQLAHRSRLAGHGGDGATAGR